jgi:phenylalanyl-tRNA synthetase alpha chain
MNKYILYEKITNILQEINKVIVNLINELFIIQLLGKKGIINNYLKSIITYKINDRKDIGFVINELKKYIINKIHDVKIKTTKFEINSINDDLTKPGIIAEIGAIHPISMIRNRISNIFNKIGFINYEGPEIEDSWHNFTALNFPYYHPARDMQDTFFMEKNLNTLLRTHTSSVQIRYMKENNPPFRIISFGKVYRNEVISKRSHCMFHQIEGLYVDKKVSFIDLKKTIKYFTYSIFGNSKIRFRPSYFPFTEPSAEVDVYLFKNKVSGWIEIMGCGMVDPKVFSNVKIDYKKYSGFAFGIGIERILILLSNIIDIRFFFYNDLRLLQQFKKFIF